MVSDIGGQALFLVLLLILPIAALVARRLPIGTPARYAATWLAIFLVAFIIVREFT